MNKGDAASPMVRCRYVAKEIAYTRDDDFFAATPPLEALRLLISHAASNIAKNLKLMVMDARKAHLHAMAVRDVFVDLPPERRRPGFCAKLRRCLYGTRDAPARWEAYLTASSPSWASREVKRRPAASTTSRRMLDALYMATTSCSWAKVESWRQSRSRCRRAS